MRGGCEALELPVRVRHCERLACLAHPVRLGEEMGLGPDGGANEENGFACVSQTLLCVFFGTASVCMEAPEPSDPTFIKDMHNCGKSGWAVVAHLCEDAEMQDNGVDVRLWRWPLEFKYQGGRWERDHRADRQWRRRLHLIGVEHRSYM